MNFGMRGHDFDATTIEQLIEKCQRYSVKYIQLVLKKSIYGFEEGMFSKEYATSIGELFKKMVLKYLFWDVIFDPVNYLNVDNYGKQTNIYDEFVKLLIDKTMVLHLKDFVVENDNIKYEYPSKGLLDLKSIIDIVKKHNPEIPIILEEISENKLNEVRNDVVKFYKENF